MNRTQHPRLILVLGSLTAIGPFSIDMYLPGFPAIARDLQTDVAHVSLSLTSYFIGISVGQLGFGPLLDRYGRKKPLIAGLLLYIAAAVGCGFSPSIAWLVTQRFFLALGSCVGIVAARAIVRDLFPVTEVARVFSTLMLVLAISPIVAPSVGAFVADTFSWRLIFAVLAAIAVLILFGVIRYLPESKAPDEAVSLYPRRIANDYVRLLKEPAFVAYGLASAAASAGLFAYISDSPFVFMTLFGLNEQQFGLVFSLSAAGVVGASQINRLWLRKMGSNHISIYSAAMQCIVGGILVVCAFLGAPVSMVLSVVIGYLVCVGFLSPNTTALAIEPFTKNAGAASALMGSAQMTAGAIGSALVSALHTGTALPMAGILAASAIGSLGVQVWYRRWAHKGSIASQT